MKLLSLKFSRRLAKVSLLDVSARLRIFKYHLLSVGKFSGARPIFEQPVLLWNNGQVILGERVVFGFRRSPGFWSTYAFVDCRSAEAKIVFGDKVHVNNGFTAICEGTFIKIGSNCLIGNDVMIFDSDFHAVDPEARLRGEQPRQMPVEIGDNVFIGSKCTILKGSVVGRNSVIGAGSVVSGIFPENSLICGNPATLIRVL